MEKYVNEALKGIDLKNDSKVKWTDYEDDVTTEKDIDLLLEDIYTNPNGSIGEEL